MARRGEIWVEGTDDCEVVKAVDRRYKVSGTPQPQDRGGYPQLVIDLAQKIKPFDDDLSATFIGVVADANGDIAARWHELSSLLTMSGYSEVPTEPPATGLILRQDGKLRFGAWLMPDNTNTGAIEDFVLQMVPADHEWLLKSVEGFVNNLPENPPRFKSKHKAKAVLRAFLAVIDAPGSHIGSITHKYAADNLLAQRFADWLTQLISDAP